MPKVLVLPDHIASQIAAGEVVERPASVVKELVENSIDAGALHIEIAIASDCRDIRVADDGCGMEADDAVLAFHRHATSKLTSAEDLFALRTMGFRGEALPSISSIARVTCYSRLSTAPTGVRVDAADGKVASRETGCAPGTAIEITDLFYNVPARLSFLKKASTEFAHIHEIVQSLAIAYPNIVFQLLNNGEVVLKTSGSGKLAQVMVEAGFLTGREELVAVQHADMRFGMAVYGYIARPVHFRGDRRYVLSVVNNRPVRCPLTYKALEHACSDLIPKGKHPIAVLTVKIPPHHVDVNVHPTKKEVKYNNSSDVYLALQRAIADALRAEKEKEPVPSITYSEETGERSAYAEGGHGFTTGNAGGTSATENAGGTSATGNAGEAPYAMAISAPARIGETDASYQSSTMSTPAMSPRATFQRIQQLGFREKLAAATNNRIATPGAAPATGGTRSLPLGWRVVGYLHNTYFLVETPQGLQIIEQHIAHERVIYERLLGEQKTSGRLTESVQRLVISAPLNLSPAQRSGLEQHIDELRKLGFDFDLHPDAAVCTQIPLELASKDYVSSVQNIIEKLLTAESAEFELEATKSVACQAAIKDGMPLSEGEIAELLIAWYHTPRNDTCPHGRPISLAFSMDKLYQLFHPA
jgi:DNA mismatch repair protein MutL